MTLSTDADEPTLRFLESEVACAISRLKGEKSPGPDGITNEMIKAGEHTLVPLLTKFFNMILEKLELPRQWTCSEIVL